MQNPGRRSEYRWLLLLPAAVLLYLSFDFLLELLDRQMLGPQPAVILRAIDGARTAPAILRRTGPINASRHTLRKDKHAVDSLLVQIRLSGQRADAHIEVYAVREASGAWRIYRSDTAFVAPR